MTQSDQFSTLIEPIARELLGEPNRSLSSKTELRYGSRGSLAVDLQKGTWFDHEVGSGGGVLDLVSRETGLREESRFEWLRDHGFDIERDDYGHNRRSGNGAQFRIAKTYDYVDEQGVLLSQVCRLEPKDFRQRKPDPTGRDGWTWSVKGVRQVPYRLPDLQERIAQQQTVFIVEGEKDCDNLAAIGIAATTNIGGAGKWRPELKSFFAGADVVIVEDNDPQKTHPKTGEPMFHEDGRPILPGQDHAQAVALALDGTAERVRVLKLKDFWPQMPPKGDISDWLEHGGGGAELLYDIIACVPDWSPQGRQDQLKTSRLFPINESDLAPRPWKVPGLLLAEHLTLLIAPAGSGKSLLSIQIGIACATGEAWGGWRPRGKYRVLFINAEDDLDEIRRRAFAAATTMKVNQELLRDQIILADNSDGIVVAKIDPKKRALIPTPLMESVVNTIIEQHIDIVFVDPFAESFEGDENSNSELKWAAMLWRQVARRTGCAICLIHHTKKYAGSMAGDPDAARGGNALIAVARLAATLFPMTSIEAELMNIKPNDRFAFLRFDDAKMNLNLKSPQARWFRKITVQLHNERDGIPGDQVGVLTPWVPPSLLDGLLEEHINSFLRAVDRGVIGKDGNPTGEFFTFQAPRKQQSRERYIVNLAAEHFDFDDSRARKLVELLKEKNRLRIAPKKYRSPNTRKELAFVISDLAGDGNEMQQVTTDDQASLL